MFIDFRVPPTTPWSMCLPQAFFPLKKYTPGFYEHVFYICCINLAISRSPCIFSKYGRSAQMTMPARRSSKFCAKRRAALLPIFFLSLICRVIPANIEPSPECQPGYQIKKRSTLNRIHKISR